MRKASRSKPEDASFCSLRGTGGVDLSNPSACACGGRWRSPAATSTDDGRRSGFSPLPSGVRNVRTPDTWGMFGQPIRGEGSVRTPERGEVAYGATGPCALASCGPA
ncbi:hypothetical protein E2562_012069 [Oryza meyeriana var. granulata]|uniref:Uncharacterized protein n=1 Tax=Oryza meyeriana var. granulata TaxID=110450 RepID=A0A6G1F7A8_9ORYZ|nr:hypothetical protein E2562_026059 [Oryza meyeriana var. granulata]KAF0932725.1 hypothetical protein E2562_012069 [Oryza meyeriana var. granulata]